MSSKQLNFFITGQDFTKVIDFIKIKKALAIINENITKDEKINLSYELSSDISSLIYLINQDFIANVRIKTTKNDIKYFDIVRSPILEFDYGGNLHTKNILNRGRFYYIKSFWNDKDILEKKSEEFVLWCNDFIKDFRKEFLMKYAKDESNLYSESAIQWIEENNAHLLGGGQQWKKQL